MDFERTYFAYDLENFPSLPLKLIVTALLLEKAVDSIRSIFRKFGYGRIPVAGNGALMSRERKRFNPRINVYSTETEVRSRSSCSTPMVVCSKYGDPISEATRVMLGNEEVSMPPRNGFGKDGLEITK